MRWDGLGAVYCYIKNIQPTLTLRSSYLKITHSGMFLITVKLFQLRLIFRDLNASIIALFQLKMDLLCFEL